MDKKAVLVGVFSQGMEKEALKSLDELEKEVVEVVNKIINE